MHKTPWHMNQHVEVQQATDVLLKDANGNERCATTAKLLANVAR